MPHAHVLSSKALADAVRHGQLVRNVAGRDRQRAPKVPAKEMTILKKDQMNDVVARLRGTEISPKVLLALFCVLAPRWSVVDMDGKIRHVRESVEEVAGQPMVIKRPKTRASIRKVTMSDVVVDGLRDHRRRQLEQRLALGLGKMPGDALLFPALDEGPSRRTALSIQWQETVGALGLPKIVFSGLGIPTPAS